MRPLLILLLIQLTQLIWPTAAAHAAVSNHSPGFIGSGYTWWYYDRDSFIYPDRPHSFAFGITIGDEVEINSQIWHQLQVKLARHMDLEDQLIEWVTDMPQDIYVREKDNTLYVMLYGEWKNIYYPFYNALGSYGLGTVAKQLTYGDAGTHFTYSVYDFDENNQIEWFDDYAEFTISEVSEINPDGTPLAMYKASCTDSFFAIEDDEITYIQGIGLVMPDNHYFTPLFFTPFQMICANGIGYPRLTYVTDSENHIVYTAFGGGKIWEDYAGLSQVTLDSSDAPVRYFNLQGVQVENPSSGTYIMQRGSYATKVHF